MAHHPDSKNTNHIVPIEVCRHHGRLTSTCSNTSRTSNIQYPASKDDLTAFAQEHAAPKPAIDLLQAIPDTMYDTLAEVNEQLSKGL